MPMDKKDEAKAPKPIDIKKEEKKDATDKKADALDFNSLDLTVEKVEERISPNETNVFDK
jgi:hypothetical protein